MMGERNQGGTSERCYPYLVPRTKGHLLDKTPNRPTLASIGARFPLTYGSHDPARQLAIPAGREECDKTRQRHVRVAAADRVGKNATTGHTNGSGVHGHPTCRRMRRIALFRSLPGTGAYVFNGEAALDWHSRLALPYSSGARKRHSLGQKLAVLIARQHSA